MYRMRSSGRARAKGGPAVLLKRDRPLAIPADPGGGDKSFMDGALKEKETCA